MMREKMFGLLMLIVLLGVLTIGVAVMAQSSATFDLSWHVIGGGGGESSSANYRVRGSSGQPLTESSTSASSRVHSGYWVFDSSARIYLPYIVKN